jgi:hypothetical protein
MRFVIQHHINNNEHFDLMIELENSDKLLVLKISSLDINSLLSNTVIKAERLPDHRKEYLEYEGPVSGGRGSVKIFDSGRCRTILYKEDKCEFELSGKKFVGKIITNYIDGRTYNVQYCPMACIGVL